MFEHDIRFLSTAFLHVQLVHTTLRRLQRQFLAPLFQYLIQYFTLNSFKKNGEIWRERGPGLGTGGALEILTQALQTCSKHLVNRSEWRRNDKDSQDRRARERKA